MGGPPAKRRAQNEKKSEDSSQGSSESRDPTQRSAPKSIPRVDGNRDPTVGVLDYTRPNDLKNLSEFLGLGGWYAARGVSTNTPSVSAHFCTHSCMHLPAQTLSAPNTSPMQTRPYCLPVWRRHGA